MSGVPIGAENHERAARRLEALADEVRNGPRRAVEAFVETEYELGYTTHVVKVTFRDESTS